jgi:predicted lipoprotein with Yx(FWY)xxD motif
VSDNERLPASPVGSGEAKGLPGRSALAWRAPARVAGAGLLAVTASIHLYLYLDGYQTIPVIGWLFLLQVVAGFALAGAVSVSAARAVAGRVAAGAGAGFAVSTLAGYLLSVSFGLFGFVEVFTIAGLVAGLVEVACFALLGSLAVAPASPARAPSGAGEGSEHGASRPGARSSGRRGTTASGPILRLRAVSAASLVALALLAGVLASAGTATATAGSPAIHVTLRTERIDGALVLTDARGFTLYWFALDTPRASHCYGTCAEYWPPVIGKPRGGSAISAGLGTVERRGGQLQATYDHHPLYTYIGDSAPGQVNGNGIFLDGGLWHEVRVRRR